MWRHSLRRRCVAVVGGEGVRLRVCPRVIEGADDGADDAGVFRITMATVGGISVARFAEDEADDAIGVFAEAAISCESCGRLEPGEGVCRFA